MATQKLDIKRELSAVDNRDYNFYDNLTAEEKKEFSPYVLMRFVSNVNGDSELQEWFLENTNNRVNKNHWLLSKNHKALLWKLYAGVGIGQTMYHPYLAASKKDKANKIEKLLAEIHPTKKMEDIKLLASMMSTEDKTNLFDSLGMDKSQRKEYK